MPTAPGSLGARVFPAVVAVLAVGLLGVVCWPIITPLFLVAVIAGTLHPLADRLTRRLRGSKTPAAALVTLAAVVVVAAPLAVKVAATAPPVTQAGGP